MRFTGRVEIVPWGRSDYRVIRVPDALADEARGQGTRRVAGTIDGVPVNLAVNRAPVVEGPFLWAGESLLHRIRAEAGEDLECVLEPVDPDRVDLPEDLRAALDEAGAADHWEALPAPARRRRLAVVDQAKRAGTRARRIAELVAALREPAR